MSGVLTEAFDCLFYSDHGGALVAEILGSAKLHSAEGVPQSFEGGLACLDVLAEIAWIDSLLLDHLIREGLKTWDKIEESTGLSRDSEKPDDSGRNAFHRQYLQQRQQRLSQALKLLCRSYGDDFVATNTEPLRHSILQVWLDLRWRSSGDTETIGELLEKRAAFWSDVDRGLQEHSILGVEPCTLGYLNTPIAEMEWTVRTTTCLQDARIVYLRDLVTSSETDLLKIPNFGRKSLREVTEELSWMGLALGLHVGRTAA